MPEETRSLPGVVVRLLELRREDELRAVSTLRGSINALSQSIENLDPGVLERTRPMFEQWLATCSVAESSALIIHASIAMLAVVHAFNIDASSQTLLDIDELLRRHVRAAAERAAKERSDVTPE